VIGNDPGIGNDCLTVVRGYGAGKLSLRHNRVDVRLPDAAVEEAQAHLVLSQVDVAIGVEIMLVQVVWRRRLEATRLNRSVIDRTDGAVGIGLARRWELLKNGQHRGIHTCNNVAIRFSDKLGRLGSSGSLAAAARGERLAGCNYSC
jgi:hypothetical protein